MGSVSDFYNSLRDLAQDDGRVFGPEPQAVTDSVLDLVFPAGFGDIVQITCRIRNFQVSGRWKFAVLHGHQGRGHSGGPAGTLRVTDLSLQARHGNLVSAIP